MIGTPEVLKLSDRISVEVAVLDGYESDRADLILAKLIGAINPESAKNGEMPIMEMALLQSKVYALCSVRKIDGQPVTPLANQAMYATAARLLTLPERQKLEKWAQPLYSPIEEDVKNEPSALPSEE